MGTWGHRLYDNDTSLDVKDQFEEELHRGKTVEDITQLMINDYECNLDIPYEAFLFWGALADTQWNWGMLLPQVQQQALHWIQELQENGVGLSAEQQKVLDDLRAKLLSPQPPVRKPRKRRLYQCKWQIGDVFAFQMEGEEAKKRNLYGRFFLIQKVSEGTWYPGHIIPIADLEARLNEMEVWSLLGLWLQATIVKLTMNALNICIFIIVYGRMIEIYLVTSIAPIPMATAMNREWGQMGQNYLRSLFALGFQGFLIIICVAIYAVLVQNMIVDTNISTAIWSCMGYTVLLCFTLFKTGSLAKSLFNSH